VAAGLITPELRPPKPKRLEERSCLPSRVDFRICLTFHFPAKPTTGIAETQDNGLGEPAGATIVRGASDPQPLGPMDCQRW